MVRSVKKALDILSFVARQDGEPVPLSKIAENVGLNAATCAHLTQTLCEESYLEKVSRRSGYVLGAQMYAGTAKQTYRKRLVELALPYMTKLCREAGASVSISTMSGGRLYVPYSVRCREEKLSRVKTLPGMLYRSASGRVFLAHMDDEELRLTVAREGLPGADEWPGAQTMEEMCALLDGIRREGVCVARRVRAGGTVSALACPVYENGCVAATLGISLPDEELDAERLNLCVRLTREAAKQFTRRLERADEEI